jgi:hypothetical protein
MIIKDSRLASNTDYHIKPLDLISICGTTVYMVVPVDIDGDSSRINMIDMETGLVYDHDPFNHPFHLHNHLMKHYDEYQLVKHKNVEMHLTGPVQNIKKGGRW